MQKLNYSRQREAIRKYLCGTDSHPTAEDVYRQIRKEYPNISLGTVYRNLGLLASTGEIIRIQGNDGCDHFDFRTEPHYHFICDSCKKVYDLPMEPYSELNAIASGSFSGVISRHSTVFYGTCEACMDKSD